MIKLNLHKTNSSVALKHIAEFLSATTMKGFNGKINDIVESSNNHITTISHFFNNGKWNEDKLLNTIKSEVVETILEKQGVAKSLSNISLLKYF